MKYSERNARIEVANQVLQTLGNFTLSYDRGFHLSWTDWKGRPISRRWSCAKNFYPPFHGQMAVGGTMTIAITQLVHWCQDKPVLPLTSWQYWGGPTVAMWRQDTETRDRVIQLLRDAGYPEKPICQFCGVDLHGKQWDWYHIPKEGPGCWNKQGCKAV